MARAVDGGRLVVAAHREALTFFWFCVFFRGTGIVSKKYMDIALSRGNEREREKRAECGQMATHNKKRQRDYDFFRSVGCGTSGLVCSR